MSQVRKLVLVFLVFSSVFMGSALVANAEASLTQGYLSCNLLEAYGTATSPYTTLYIYNATTNEEYFSVLPVTNGEWSGSVSFPEAPLGTLMFIQIWGSLAPYTDIFNDPNYWDGDEVWVYEDVPCGVEDEPITSSCPFPLPADSVLYNVPAGAPAYFNPDLQSGTNFSLPAGTWKISEFKDEFAKVWIACEANPIWIPSSAVGDAIG